MAKDRKEKREPKTEKRSLLKVKSKNDKFKKKAAVNESVQNEQSPVIIEDKKGKRVRKGEKNTMAKLMKKKLKEKMNKKVKQSVEVKNDEKIVPSENEEKIISGKDKKNKKVKRSLEVKNEEKISSENEKEKITHGKEKKKTKDGKKKDLKLKKKEKKLKESFEENEEKHEEISLLNEGSSKGIKRKSIEENEEITADEISLVDEDSSKGMKKWLKEYKDSRLDTDILLKKIDDFIIDHEAKLEQEKKERELKLAEEGWTVVSHNKGRKKSTDAETGTGFGSVNEAAVLERLAKKKRKNETHLEFYGFQRRQAHRSEIMKLQSEFEKDKKLVQQMKAARKFRP